jgi:hypothetical protein
MSSWLIEHLKSPSGSATKHDLRPCYAKRLMHGDRAIDPRQDVRRVAADHLDMVLRLEHFGTQGLEIATCVEDCPLSG